MDGDGNGEDLTPFWVQSTANLRRGDRLRRGFAAVFFSSGLVVFLLLVTAVFFLVFVVPSTLSLSVNIFRPNSVKKSWDSLNVVLVLVAVVFGFLSRNKNEDREKEKERERGSYYDEFRESSIKENESQKSNLSAANQWYGYSDYEAKLEQRNLSLRRNSSSYPDLREVSPTYWGYGDYQRRYYDDIYVDSGRVAEQGQIHHRRHRSLEQVDFLRETPRAKTVFVDTLVSKSMEATNQPSLPSPPTAAATPDVDEEITNGSAATRGEKSDVGVETFDPISAPKPPLPPPEEYQSPGFEEDQRRTYERVARKRERSSRRRNKNVESTAPITAPPPPPPPEQKSSKSDKKRVGATGNSAKDFLNSLYNKKKKKQRQKSVDNMDSLLHEAQPPVSFQIPPPSPPPPPPPPPPPSAFQNLFLSKKQKRKRTITVRLEPYPPAPPPPPPREPKPTSQAAAMKTDKPPKPIKMHSFDKLDEASNSGGESPLNRIPPPPPPPPPAFFKSPAWKFVVEGDYVRVNSSTSSRSGSPDPDETESDVTPSAAAFHPSPLFCPSPDVDTKAESFITNFRAKLKLEKNDSMKRREPGLSSLGPSRS